MLDERLSFAALLPDFPVVEIVEMVFSVSSVLMLSAQVTGQCAGDLYGIQPSPLTKCCSETLSGVRSILLAGRKDGRKGLQWRTMLTEYEQIFHEMGRLSRYRSGARTAVCSCRAKLREDKDALAGEPLREHTRRPRNAPDRVTVAGELLKEEGKLTGLELDGTASDDFFSGRWVASGPDDNGLLIDETFGSNAEFRVSPEVQEGVQQGEDVGRGDWEWPDSDLDLSHQPSTSGKSLDKVDNKRFRVKNGREIYEERAYLVGIERKEAKNSVFSISESLAELGQLADTAGLVVAGSTYQKLEHPSPKTYIGSGKVGDVKAAVRALDVETVIFDDELSPGQLRNLEKEFGNDVRVCDRTALILDIFNQRAATREASLQVELAQLEYQLPRLTRMWSHLERQAGGLVKGMGEKQIEVDKRLLRSRIAALKKDLESVREHRQQYRDRRASVPIPVLSLVGYTNAGKSTLLNRLSNAGVLAEDQLFATLDPTTRRVELPNGKEVLFTDTVGFIQKLPTQLVAAFRATLEEISDSSLMLHIIDISHPMAGQQIEAVTNVLSELDVGHIPFISVWNKIDRADESDMLRAEAARRGNVVCLSAVTGEGMDEFFKLIENKIKDLLVRVQAVVPYGQGELVNSIHRLGIVEQEEYIEQGTLVTAHVPLALSRQLLPLRQQIIKL